MGRLDRKLDSEREMGSKFRYRFPNKNHHKGPKLMKILKNQKKKKRKRKKKTKLKMMVMNLKTLLTPAMLKTLNMMMRISKPLKMRTPLHNQQLTSTL